MDEFKMRPSKVLDKLRAGELVLCGKTNFSCPRAAEMLALCGYDCIWLCLEHGPNSLSAIESQIYAVKSRGADVMVRVSKGSYSDLVKPLELDASGIMVPHVKTAAEARQIVRDTRFHPVGMRPADGGNADGMYCLIPFTEYIKQANANRFVMIQIEDVEALDELDAICAVEGIDVIFYGPGDFSQSVGAPGDFAHTQGARHLQAGRRHRPEAWQVRWHRQLPVQHRQLGGHGVPLPQLRRGRHHPRGPVPEHRLPGEEAQAVHRSERLRGLTGNRETGKPTKARSVLLRGNRKECPPRNWPHQDSVCGCGGVFPGAAGSNWAVKYMPTCLQINHCIFRPRLMLSST